LLNWKKGFIVWMERRICLDLVTKFTLKNLPKLPDTTGSIRMDPTLAMILFQSTVTWLKVRLWFPTTRPNLVNWPDASVKDVNSKDSNQLTALVQRSEKCSQDFEFVVTSSRYVLRHMLTFFISSSTATTKCSSWPNLRGWTGSTTRNASATAICWPKMVSTFSLNNFGPIWLFVDRWSMPLVLQAAKWQLAHHQVESRPQVVRCAQLQWRPDADPGTLHVRQNGVQWSSQSCW